MAAEIQKRNGRHDRVSLKQPKKDWVTRLFGTKPVGFSMRRHNFDGLYSMRQDGGKNTWGLEE